MPLARFLVVKAACPSEGSVRVWHEYIFGFKPKLDDRRPTCLILELPHHLFIGAVIERAALWIASQIELFTHRAHALIEVLGTDFIHVGIRVSEEQSNPVTVFLLHHVIMKPKE